MKHYLFNLNQVNKKKDKVFEVNSKILIIECEDDIINKIVEFIFECHNINKILKSHNISSPNIPTIRLSYPINLIIKDVLSNFEINFTLKEYKEALLKNLKIELFEIIKAQFVLPTYDDNENLIQEDKIEIKFSNDELLHYEFGEEKKDNLKENKLNEFEVFSICRGLEDKYFQKLSRRFFDRFKLSQTEFNECYNMALMAIEKYGKEHIEYLIELPNMPFKTNGIRKLFCEIERNRIHKSEPELIISLKSNINSEDIVIKYFTKSNKNMLIVSEKKSAIEICRIIKNGYLIPNSGVKRIIPVIKLLMKTSELIEEKMIYFGHEEGRCYICSRKLTDLESVLIGIGPICRIYL